MARDNLITSEKVQAPAKVVCAKPDARQLGFGSGDFGATLVHLKLGGRVGREKWPKFMYLDLDQQNGVIIARSTTPDTTGSEWHPISSDLLAKDWHSVELPKESK